MSGAGVAGAMSKIRLRHRARMREKEVRRLNDELATRLGVADAIPSDAEHAKSDEYDVLVHGGHVIAIMMPGDDKGAERIMLTVRGLLRVKPTKAYVTVDMGAVRFVINGADIMAPGITEADPELVPGDLVWIRDEKNGQPLGIGEAVMTGPEMAAGSKGKAVKSVHHVGDELWDLGG